MLVNILATRMHCDTQRIEGINSSIKACARQSPNLSLPLLSARVGLAHQLVSPDRANRWSSILPVLEDVHLQAVDHAEAIRPVLSAPGRWVAPLPTAGLTEPPAVGVQLQLRCLLGDLSPRHAGQVLASHRAWFRLHKSIGAADNTMGCFAFTEDLQVGSTVWAVPVLYRSEGMLFTVKSTRRAALWCQPHWYSHHIWT